MTRQPMSVNQAVVVPQPMSVGQPGVLQPGMPSSQIPIPPGQIPPSQPGMMQGFMPGPDATAGAMSSTAAQSPLDIFVGPQQSATQPELRQQQQRTIWSGE